MKLASSLASDLANEIQNSRDKPLIICGAGVSKAGDPASPDWRSLIESGIARVLGLNLCEPRWAERQKMTLAEGDADEWISVADLVTDRLGGQNDAEFKQWIKDSLQGLQLKNSSLHDALKALSEAGLLIATTNYDGLLTAATNLQPILWTDTEKVTEFLLAKRAGILHLHGFYDNPETIILGTKSYQRHIDEQRLNFLKQMSVLQRSSILIGCSQDGLNDPDLGRINTWLSDWKGIRPRRYWLVPSGQDAKTDLARGLYPVEYGSHAELPEFLTSLISPPDPSPSIRTAHPTISSNADILTIDHHEPKRICFGREQEIEAIVQATMEDRPVVLSGAPGIGKSTVAIEAFYDPRVKAKYGDRRIFVALDEISDPRDALNKLATSLGVSGAGSEAGILHSLTTLADGAPIAAILGREPIKDLFFAAS